MAEKDLVISNFQKGIGDSYLEEFQSFVNLDVDTVPGAVLVNFQTEEMLSDSSNTGAKSISVVTGDSLIVVTDHGYSNYDSVTFATTGSLPDGLSTNTVYYVNVVNDNNFRVAASLSDYEAGNWVVNNTAGSNSTVSLVSIAKPLKFEVDENQDTYYKYWMLDSDGNIWAEYQNETWVVVLQVTDARDIAIWEDYLVISRNTAVDLYGKLSEAFAGTATQTVGWQTGLTAASTIVSYVSTNGFLYIGRDNDVQSLNLIVGQTFDPTDGNTYTWSASALDLAENYIITALTEIGDFLLVGTKSDDDANKKTADVFPWDKVSSSFTNPLRLNEDGVSGMISLGNIAYVFAGTDGHIYQTNGVSIPLFKAVPHTFFDIQQDAGSIFFYHNSIVQHKGKIYFGMDSGVAGAIPEGVFSLDPNNATLKLEHTISQGNIATVPCLISIGNDDMRIGWQSGSLNGVDKIDVDVQLKTRYNNDEAYFETGLIRLGRKYRKGAAKHHELSLAKPLPGGCSVGVYERANVTENYTLVGTMNTAGQQTKVFDKTFTQEFIQYKVVINGVDTSESTPEFLELRVY